MSCCTAVWVAPTTAGVHQGKWKAFGPVSVPVCESREGKRMAAAMKAPHCSTKAGRKRLAVEHISLELLQQGGYFDMPIQVLVLRLHAACS